MRRSSRPVSAALLLILILATLHCTRSIFFVNQSWIHLDAYERGLAPNPYQSRVLMAPVLRWASHVRVLERIARWQNQVAAAPEAYSPEKIFCVLLGGALLLATGGLLTLYQRRRGAQPWYLPWLLLLEILFTSYAARSTQANWYPYDLLNLFFCTVAALAILERKWLPLLVLMPLATANRETPICWVVLWVFANWEEQRRWKTMLQAAVLGLLWSAVYIGLKVHFADLPVEVNAPWLMNLKYVLGPWSWPQMFSMLGYLPLLLIAQWKRIAPRSRRILMGMCVAAIPILWRGLWTESRIFLDFAPLFVLICSGAVDETAVFAGLWTVSTGRREERHSGAEPLASQLT